MTRTKRVIAAIILCLVVATGIASAQSSYVLPQIIDSQEYRLAGCPGGQHRLIVEPVVVNIVRIYCIPLELAYPTVGIWPTLTPTVAPPVTNTPGPTTTPTVAPTPTATNTPTPTATATPTATGEPPMAIVVQDTFTDTNGTAIASHTPDTAPGGSSWTARVGTWDIQSNAAGMSSTAASGHATIDSGIADGVLTIEADSQTGSTATTSDAGFVVRWSDTSNYWIIGINAAADTFRITERNAGTNTVRATTSVTINTATYYTIEVTLDGATISATLDGANSISYGSATLNQTVTVHGLKAQNSADRLDDLVIDDAASGTAYNQSADGTLTSAGALIRSTGKVSAGTLTTAGALLKSTAKAMAGALTSAGDLSRNTGKTLAGTLTSAGAVLKSTAKSFAGTLTSSGVLTQIRTYLVTVAGTLTSDGALLRSTGKVLAGTLTSAGDINKAIAKAFAGTLTSAGELARSTAKSLAGTLTSSGALATARAYLVSLAGTLTSDGALSRSTSKALAGALTTAGSISKAIGKVLSGALTSLGSLLAVLAGSVTPHLDVEVSDAVVTVLTLTDSAVYTVTLSDQSRS